MKPRVLVVDDDPAIRSSLELALDLEGYQVAVAADGAEALTTMRDDRPDVLVLDLMMPGVDGLTVCRVLRAEKDRMPILMLTARTDTSDRVEGLDAGADDYLPKPFDLEELLARLRALVRRTQPQRRVRAATGPTSASVSCASTQRHDGRGVATTSSSFRRRSSTSSSC